MARGLSTTNGSTFCPGRTGRAQRPQRDHVGDRRLAKEHGDLAEELAAAEPGALVAIDHDRRLAVEDDVEGGSPARPCRRTFSPSANAASSKRWTMAARRGPGKSANSAKPAIASISSSTLSHGAHRRRSSRCPCEGVRAVDASPDGGAAWRRRRRRTHDAHSGTASQSCWRAPGCSTVSTPTGWNGSRQSRSRSISRRTMSSRGRARSGRFLRRRRRRGPGRSRRRDHRDPGSGDFFGKLSVLDGKPRNASVVADGPTSCLALPTWDFETVLREEPSVAIAILRELAGRLRDLTEADRHSLRSGCPRDDRIRHVGAWDLHLPVQRHRRLDAHRADDRPGPLRRAAWPPSRDPSSRDRGARRDRTGHRGRFPVRRVP